MRTEKTSFDLHLILVITLAALSWHYFHPVKAFASSDQWAAVRAADIAQTEPGWSSPKFLGVNSYDGWIDSVEVSADGKKIYYGFYPGADLMADIITGDLKGDNDIYVSEYPFETHQPVKEHFMSEIPWSACCVHRDEEGYFWYNSNREGRPDGSQPGNYEWHAVFRNSELMPFSKPAKEMGDVFYCKEKDELWLHSDREGMLILSQANAGGFSGSPKAAPDPISAGRQPFLTHDGDTLYFTANFGDIPSQGPAVYRSKRNGLSWSKPEPVIWSKTGVGEATLTKDGRQLFFVQLFENLAGQKRIAVFFINKI